MLARSPKERVSIAMKWDITPKIAPNPNRAMGGSKGIAPTTNLAQNERNHLICNNIKNMICNNDVVNIIPLKLQLLFKLHQISLIVPM
jgi:hypothetical protein